MISHCGWGAVTECILNLKPILAIPGFADQIPNSEIIEAKKLGLVLRRQKGFVLAVFVLDNPTWTTDELS